MQLVVQDNNGKAIASLSDYELDLQYGDGDCDFQLYAPDLLLKKHYRILVDGMPYGGIVDARCPSNTRDGDSIMYKGRSVQGVLKSHIIIPPSGQSHYVASGDANAVIGNIISAIGLSGYFKASTELSGIQISNYRFYRYIDAYSGLRMMLANVGARLEFQCADAQHIINAVPRDNYDGADSERLEFELDIVDLPINHLIGLGEGQGTARAVSHWYADLLGNVSQTQSLFGVLEKAEAYQLNSEEAETLPGKTKKKLLEYQTASEASLKLPPGTKVDVGDRIVMSNAKYGISATAEVTQVVLKAALGVEELEYKFGVPDYPEDED